MKMSAFVDRPYESLLGLALLGLAEDTRPRARALVDQRGTRALLGCQNPALDASSSRCCGEPRRQRPWEAFSLACCHGRRSLPRWWSYGAGLSMQARRQRQSRCETLRPFLPTRQRWRTRVRPLVRPSKIERPARNGGTEERCRGARACKRLRSTVFLDTSACDSGPATSAVRDSRSFAYARAVRPRSVERALHLRQDGGAENQCADAEQRR
jgi:hypothetical protein